jgi:hypothetical protein
LDEYNKQIAEAEAEKKKANNQAALANAENKLARAYKQIKDNNLRVKVMKDDEVVALVDKQLDETYQDDDGRVHQRLPDRFATEGRIHFLKNGDRKEAMKQVTSMQQELAKIKADELKPEDREILDAAQKNGSTRLEDQFEKNMGYMLSRVEDLQRHPLRRYLFKTKLTPERQRKVALDQLRLLTGQMSEKELKKYNRPSIKKIILMILSMALAVTATQAVETFKDASTADMPGQRGY